MKKSLALFLAVLMLLSCFSIAAFAQTGNTKALPLSAGIDALRNQFEKGEGSELNGYTIDYRYYSPVANEEDSTKYPLVIWLHGMGQGFSEGMQLKENDIAFWSSSEFQSRFPASGAFILVPRAPELKNLCWSDSMIEPLKKAIDEFIAANYDNIDFSRIYIGGFSMGGKMTLKMAIAYPEMFAAIFPICPAWTPSAKQTAHIADIPVWLTSGAQDFVVNYNGVSSGWKNIIASTNVAENCRFSTLAKTAYPDGKVSSNAHEAWYSVTYDMFSVTNEAYPYLSTVDGNGNTVTLTYPDGMISWLSQFTSDYDGTASEGTGNIKARIGLIDTLIKLFAKIRVFFENLF